MMISVCIENVILVKENVRCLNSVLVEQKENHYQ